MEVCIQKEDIGETLWPVGGKESEVRSCSILRSNLDDGLGLAKNNKGKVKAIKNPSVQSLSNGHPKGLRVSRCFDSFFKPSCVVIPLTLLFTPIGEPENEQP